PERRPGNRGLLSAPCRAAPAGAPQRMMAALLRRTEPVVGRIPYKWLVLTVSCTGVFMSALDSTIVNIAVASFIRTFHASVADVQWVITAYLLALGASIPLAGYLADR